MLVPLVGMACVAVADNSFAEYQFTVVIPVRLSAVFNGEVTVHVVQDVVTVSVQVPKEVTVVRGGTASIKMIVHQTHGYKRYFSVQVVLPSKSLTAKVSAAKPINSRYPNEWLGDGNVTIQVKVPLSAEGGTNYALGIKIYASRDPASVLSSPPVPPAPVIYNGSKVNVGDEWRLCGKIGFSPNSAPSGPENMGTEEHASRFPIVAAVAGAAAVATIVTIVTWGRRP